MTENKETITTVKAVTCMRKIRGTVRKVATFFIISLLILFAKKEKSMGKKDLGKIIHMPLLYVLIYLLIISIIMIHAL